jgi:hypothetical protein
MQKSSCRPGSGRTQQYETIASSNKAKEHWVRVRAEEQAPVVTRPHIASAVNRLERKNKKRQSTSKNARHEQFNSRSDNEFGAYGQGNMGVTVKSMKRPSIENMPDVDYTSFGNLTESEYRQR